MATVWVHSSNGHPATGIVADGWIGRTLAIGEAVRLHVTGACPRCVMTTLAQSDLPRDPKSLRTAAQQNRANVGVDAAVVRGGEVRRGDLLRLA
ncbi:MAG: MOSC domain-containing protein [Chloroflexota bacterium]